MDESTAPTLTIPAPVPVTGTAALRAPDTKRARFWRTYVTEVRADADARSDIERAADPVGVDRRMVVILVTVAIALTCNHFLQGPNIGWLTTPLRGIGLDGLARRLDDAMHTSQHAQFNQLAFWAVVQITSYVVPAVLVIRFVLHDRVANYGLRARGILPHARTYGVLYAIALPGVVLASFSVVFQHRYPFYDLAPHEGFWPYLYLWWILYWLQFVSLEFFFRGFMVHGLAPRFGWAAIFVMVVPYNMLHYGKPMLEATAAIVGGIVLGTLSLKTRSIWLGAGLHISIALTMDLLALWHRGVVF